MAENLNYAAEGSNCYDGDPANCAKYGRLYNWETAITVCPDGWHLPGNAEWDILLHFADGTSDASSPYSSETAGMYLKAAGGWGFNGNGQSGNDIHGFAALPGGCYSSLDYGFIFEGGHGYWWSESESESNSYHAQGMGMFDYNDEAHRGVYDKLGHLLSVRCIKDD
jgi:uncharacterized protein (TIGR02145 family)